MKSNEFAKPFYQKPWFFIVAGIVVLLIISAIFSKKTETNKYDTGNSSDTKSTTQTSQPPLSEENKPEARKNEPNIGIIEKTNTIIKVIKYEDNAKTDNEFVQPKDGFKYLAYEIEVDNTNGTEKLTLFASGSFKLQDGDSYVYEAKAIVGKEPMFNPSNSIGIGDKVKGWVTFEVPAKTRYNRCKIKYDFLGTETDWVETK